MWGASEGRAPRRRPWVECVPKLGFWLSCLASLILLGGGPALAQPAAPPTDEVRLSLARYASLVEAARLRAGGAVSWSRASVQVQIQGDWAEVELTAAAEPLGEGGPTSVVLLPADVVLLAAAAGGEDLALTPAGGTHTASLTAGERHDLRLRYRVLAGRDAEGRRFALVPLPPVPGSRVTVAGAPDARLWPGDGSDGDLPATPGFLVRWGDGAPGDLVRRVDYELRPDDAGDGVDVVARFEVNTTERNARVRVARADAALVDLRGPKGPLAAQVRDGWHVAVVATPGANSFEARLRLAIDRTRGQPQVVLTPDRVPMARVQLSVAGRREVTFEPVLPLRTEVKGEGDAAVTVAEAHLPPVDSVTLRWTEARATPESQVRVIARSDQLLTLKEGFLKSTVHLNYEITNGKVDELPIALPEGVDVYRVSGDGIEDWQILPATEAQPRQVRVVLGEARDGRQSLTIELERNIDTEKPGTALEVPVLAAIGASRQEGVVALLDGDKVGFAPAEDPQSKYRKVGQDALSVDVRQGLRAKVDQAFKFINEIGPLRSKVAPAQAGEVRFDARVDTLYALREGSLLGNAAVVVEIKSGRRDVLHLSLPKGLAEPRVTAPSLNKVEPAPDFDAGAERTAYAVRFTQALEGAIQIDVEFERILGKDENGLELPGVVVHGAEVESGSLGLSAETGMEVKAGEPRDLRRVPVEELPKAVRLRSDRELVFGYTYARAPWGLPLTLKRNRTVETLSAVATHARLETHVLGNGHVVTRAVYEVVNDDRQYVRLGLPEGAEVLRVSAGDDKVKAVADEKGAVAIPLPKNATTRVELVYEVVQGELGSLGSLALVAPRLDLRVSDVQWRVRAPQRLAFVRTDTRLSSGQPMDWRPLSETGGGTVPVELPVEQDMGTWLYSFAVQEPTLDVPDGALGIQVWFTAGGGTAEPGLLVLAALLLALTVRRRVRGQGGGVVLGLVGIGLLVLKTTVWSLSLAEGLGVAAVVVVVAVISRRKTPKADA